jgi:hypothetical protein
VSMLASGFYLARVELESGVTVTRKIIVEWKEGGHDFIDKACCVDYWWLNGGCARWSLRSGLTAEIC